MSSSILSPPPPGTKVNINKCEEFVHWCTELEIVFGTLLRDFEQPYFVRLEKGEVTGDGDDDGDLNYCDDEDDDEEEDVVGEEEDEEEEDNFFEGFECCCFCEMKFENKVSLHDFAASFHRLRELERRRLVQYMMYSFTNRDEQRDTNKKRKLEKEGEDMSQTKARTYVDYQVMGVRVCRGFFLRVVGCSQKLIENCLKSVAQGIVVYETRRKGSKKETSNKKKYKRDSISLFLTHFGEREALPCPTGRGSTEDQPVLYPPLQFPKVRVHSIYNSCASPAMQCDSSFFWKVWKRKFPFLKCLTKRTNFCDICLFLINHHMAPEYELHLKLAREMRAHIQENILDSISSYQPNGPKTLHLSFDVAEAVRLPQFTDQLSAFFFHSGLKVDLFGVAIDTEGYQHTFVLLEGH